jgi:cytochrome oxidase assembly protein ShyY1
MLPDTVTARMYQFGERSERTASAQEAEPGATGSARSDRIGWFLLRPKWIGFHLLVIAAIVAMVNLGLWQLRRLDERRDFNTVVAARYDAAPVDLDALVGPAIGDPGDPRLDEVEWRPVTATGTYRQDASIQIVNRSQGGRAGENTVTPLALPDGRVLLVNRGFVPLSESAPPAPAGTVTVTGRLRPSETRRTGQLSDPADGVLTVAQRIDLGRLASQFDAPLVPMYLSLLASEPADGDPYPEPVARPDLTEGPHLSYAVQWFIFSTAVAVGWALAVRHSVSKHRATSGV